MNPTHHIKLPEVVRKGDPVKAEDYNAIRAALQSLIQRTKNLQIQPSVDIGVKTDGTQGQLLYLKKASRGNPSGVSCSAFRLGMGEAPNQLTVTESTILGVIPGDFVDGKKIFTIASTDGKIYGKITIGADGEPTNAQVLQGAEVPANTGADHHIEIGTFRVEGNGPDAVLSFSQTKCGPLNATVCRNWFAAEAPYFGVSWL
jgi:hypothetical protein